MTSTERVWLTPQARSTLQAELAELLAEDRTWTSDTAAGQDYLFTTQTRQARIRQIQDLLNKAVTGEDPPDDGIAEPGMVLTVRYDDIGETETFLLGVRGAEHGDLEVYSPQSPLGAALAGARQGEQRTYRVPTGATVRVTLLNAVPYSHTTATVRSESIPVEAAMPQS